MARTTPDQKAKKQKIVLAVGGVILLAVLAFQLPKLMKGSPSPAAAPAATTTSVGATGTPAATPTAAAPTAAATTAAAPASSSVPMSSELTFASSVTKVASLSRFHGKDPFKPSISLSDLNTTAPPATTPAATAVPPPATTTTPKGPLFGTVEGSTPPAATTPSAKGATSKKSSLPSATIMFNGKKLHLKLGEAFPKAAPVFRLAGIQSGNVLVALVKGGLADGSAVITLPTRHPVTLVNTVDNTRYTLVLLTGKKKKGA